ncbi:3-phosphoshikimate 1-carboxyvinyltransferase [Weissella confusa]|uniref:3-phosphoshikimate 1-carboxyvinyltransferase n=1 Tax=Weissella confusa TaxID=1583 RepID=UPI0022E172D1|nr:3-phosphoshikimate 1-carboxyvinyltransferase [Weissella confusa]
MTNRQLKTAATGINGQLTVPGDKSISHRAVMLGSIATGETTIYGLLDSDDVRNTLGAMQQLGVTVDWYDDRVVVHGRPLTTLTEPDGPLDMGNSGTSTRLLMGLLANQSFPMTFVGDASLSTRPLARVIDPLTKMGARFVSTNHRLPVTTMPGFGLHGIHYRLPVASAQVKSALILAGLQAEGETVITEPLATRDHTERMLQQFGVAVVRDGQDIIVTPNTALTGTTINVPGDISSAAFWIVAALLVPHSELRLIGVGINPTRDGILRLLRRMGAVIELDNVIAEGEPTADLIVRTQALQGTAITSEDIPTAVDEIPMLVLAATQALGDTLITGAQELHVKETDRIATVTTQLNKLGANIEAREDGFLVHGGTPLHVEEPTVVDSSGDHRIGMMLAIAALLTDGEVALANADSVSVSYPSFFADLERLVED